MSEKKDDVDALAHTGFAQKPVDPLAQTGFAQKPVDPLAATSFGAHSPASTVSAGKAGIDPLAQTSHAAPPAIDPLAQTSHSARPAIDLLAQTTDDTRPVAPAPTAEPQAPARPTPVSRARANGVRWAVLAIVLVGAVVAGIVMASRSDHPRAATGSAAPVAVAPTPAPPPTPAPTTVEALLSVQDQALADGRSASFEALLAPDIFGIGLDAGEVRSGLEPNFELVRHVISAVPRAFTTKRWVGHTADAAWAATVYTFADGHQVELTEAVTKHADHWWIDAWHWSVPLANGRAYELAQAGMLPKPAAMTASGDPEVAGALSPMLQDREAYVRAISKRDDAFAFGSAPGEVMVGGAAIARAFSHMGATFAIRSGPVVRRVADDLAFEAADVDFTNKAGTQTFRVLLVAALEHNVRWTIVQAHWSNAATTADSTTGSGRSASPPAR